MVESAPGGKAHETKLGEDTLKTEGSRLLLLAKIEEKFPLETGLKGKNQAERTSQPRS